MSQAPATTDEASQPLCFPSDGLWDCWSKQTLQVVPDGSSGLDTVPAQCVPVRQLCSPHSCDSVFFPSSCTLHSLCVRCAHQRMYTRIRVHKLHLCMYV